MARLLAIDPPPHGWQLVSSSSNARVAYHSEEQLYYKEFYPRGPLERLKSVLVGSRATRSRKNDAALLSEGFGAPLHVTFTPNGSGCWVATVQAKRPRGLFNGPKVAQNDA